MLADAALVFGLVGAVTGLLATAVSIFAVTRDRPILSVRADFPSPNQNLAGVVPIAVANNGRQPVAVAAIGFTYRGPASSWQYWSRRLVRRRGLGSLYTTGWISYGEEGRDTSFVLEPGQFRRIRAVIHPSLDAVRVDSIAVWACVWDTRGRISRSAPALVSATTPNRVLSSPGRFSDPVRAGYFARPPLDVGVEPDEQDVHPE